MVLKERLLPKQLLLQHVASQLGVGALGLEPF